MYYFYWGKPVLIFKYILELYALYVYSDILSAEMGVVSKTNIYPPNFSTHLH